MNLLRFTLCAALILASQPGALAKKPKPPKQPTQADFQKGCISVTDIYSHRYGFTTSPGLEADVHNTCDRSVLATFTIAYFDRDGLQFGNGLESMTMAPGASWHLHHVANLTGIERGRLKFAEIIGVLTVP
jgi:hypothetical protein